MVIPYNLNETACNYYATEKYLKVHLHEISKVQFLSSKINTLSPDSYSKLALNINSNLLRYSTL